MLENSASGMKKNREMAKEDAFYPHSHLSFPNTRFKAQLDKMLRTLPNYERKQKTD